MSLERFGFIFKKNLLKLNYKFIQKFSFTEHVRFNSLNSCEFLFPSIVVCILPLYQSNIPENTQLICRITILLHRPRVSPEYDFAIYFRARTRYDVTGSMLIILAYFAVQKCLKIQRMAFICRVRRTILGTSKSTANLSGILFVIVMHVASNYH